MEKKKKKTVNVFFSEQIERFLFRAFWSTAIICNLSSSDKKKKRRMVVDYRSISTDTILVYVCVKKKKRSTGDMNTVHLL